MKLNFFYANLAGNFRLEILYKSPNERCGKAKQLNRIINHGRSCREVAIIAPGRSVKFTFSSFSFMNNSENFLLIKPTARFEAEAELKWLNLKHFFSFTCFFNELSANELIYVAKSEHL